MDKEIKPGKPKPDTKYLGFSKVVTYEFAFQQFVNRFNEAPDEIFLNANMVWAGPIPDQRVGDRITKRDIKNGTKQMDPEWLRDDHD